MRIKSIRIKNLRSIKDCKIDLDPYTALVGPNGAGKSAILFALNIFFRETNESTINVGNLGRDDFHERNTSEPIEITVTFNELSKGAQEDLKHYVRQNELVLTSRAVFVEGDDADNARVEVDQYGERQVMEEFRKFFERAKAKPAVPIDELRDVYGGIREKFPDLPEIRTKKGMEEALREYEEANPDRCTLIPSKDELYGASKGANLLAKHVQWIYVPAVKDAMQENSEARNALGKLLTRTVRTKISFDEKVKDLENETLEKYQKLLNDEEGALEEISESLTDRLSRWAHPDAKARLVWTESPKSVEVQEPTARLHTSESGFESDTLARFGHGLQRSYLLALLEELASAEDPEAATLILGCEEPELYQHPPQARHLADVLEKLKDRNTQVLVSTHSPYFVSGRHFESLRMVRREHPAKQTEVSSVRFEQIANRIAEVTGEKPDKPSAQEARLHRALQPNLSEMFFASRIVFVEGLEDAAYITASLLMSDKWDEFRERGAHIVPVSGKSNLVEPLAIAQLLSIPAFVVYDADGDESKPENRKRHEKNNRALLGLLGRMDDSPFPTETIWEDRFVLWPKNLKKSLIEEITQNPWDKTLGEATKQFFGKDAGGTEYRTEGSFAKDPILIGHHVKMLHEKKIWPNILEKLCEKLCNF